MDKKREDSWSSKRIKIMFKVSYKWWINKRERYVWSIIGF